MNSENIATPNNKTAHIRKRTVIPYSIKVYSVYQYDYELYKRIFYRVHNLAMKYDLDIFRRTSAYKVLDNCYYKDEQGKRIRLGDERFIYRYGTLQKVYQAIADFLISDCGLIPTAQVREYLYNRTHLNLAYNDQYSQAEIIETYRKPINERLRAHIELLRKLRNGADVETAVKEVRQKYKIPFNKRYSNIYADAQEPTNKRL